MGGGDKLLRAILDAVKMSETPSTDLIIIYAGTAELSMAMHLFQPLGVAVPMLSWTESTIAR